MFELKPYVSSFQALMTQDGAIVDRIPVQIRRALGQGKALHILAVILFTTGCLFGAHAWHRYEKHSKDTLDRLAGMMQADHEPRRDERRIGVVASVLGRLNADTTSSAECPPDETVCRRMDATVDLFQKLVAADQFVEGSSSRPIDPPLRPGDEVIRTTTLAGGGLDPGRIDDLAKTLKASLVRQEFKPDDWIRELKEESAAPKVVLGPCPYAPRPQPDPSWDRRLGEPFCETKPDRAGEYVPLIIPSTARAPSDRRLQAEAFHSRLLGAAIAPFFAQCHIDPNAFSVASIYFVGPDNLLRLWDCGGDRQPIAERLPHSRNWAAAKYFEQIVQGGGEGYHSQIYIDYIGHGLVRTNCKAVTKDDRLLGAICVDQTVPIEILKKSLTDDEPLFEIEELTIKARRDWPLRASDLTLAPKPWRPGAPSEDERRATIRDLLNDNYHRPSRGGAGDGPSTAAKDISANGVTTLRGPTRKLGEERYLVPLGRRTDGSSASLLVTPRNEGPHLTGFILLLIVCWAGAIGLLAVGEYTARQERLGAVMSSLLRNLEIGVVLVGSDEVIEGANDRAQEMLGVPLPMFNDALVFRQADWRGLRDRELDRLSFLDFAEDWIVTVDDNGKPHEKATRYVDAVPTLRREGLASSYYAKLKHEKPRWIRVSAAPVHLAMRDASQTHPATFAVLDVVRWDETIRLLEAAFEKRSGATL